MKLYDTEAERLFDAKIDARFPYDDSIKSTALIEEAKNISLNAAFCVLEEICRPPRGTIVERERQDKLIQQWSSGFEHELKIPLLRCVRALVDGEPLPSLQAFALFDQVKLFDGQYAALNLIYYATHHDDPDADAFLYSARQLIVSSWDTSR